MEDKRNSLVTVKKRKRAIQFAIVLVLIVLGLLGMHGLTSSKPQLKKKKSTTPAPVVRVLEIRTGQRSVFILGEGTVKPVEESNLVPQVDGKVVYISPSLVNGGQFRKSEVLVRIDPVDYRLAVTLSEAKVKSAESLLRLAEEESAAAIEEWRILNTDSSEGPASPPPLVAKEPQLAAARAKLKADKADLKKALLSLERSELRAPFDGRVSQEQVDVGQYVSPGQVLAGLYSTKAAEIVVPLENKDLFWFHVPGFTAGKGPGASASVLANVAGHDLSWQGRVVRAEGKLDERTRMVNVVVRVEKPYASKPPLAAGLFVKVRIAGRTLKNASLIPRVALHQENIVWAVNSEERLHFRKTEVARIQGDSVLVRSGLSDGDKVVITPIKSVTDGMKVRTVLVKEANS